MTVIRYRIVWVSSSEHAHAETTIAGQVQALHSPDRSTSLLRTASRAQHLTDLFDASMLASEVNHCVAVWAYRSQVVHRIHLILTGDVGKRVKMVDVNEPFRHVPVHGAEVGTAHTAHGSVSLDASNTSFRIALVSID